jgi:PKD domain-containing protein/parallel beta helix pectate lyase-like protein
LAAATVLAPASAHAAAGRSAAAGPAVAGGSTVPSGALGDAGFAGKTFSSRATAQAHKVSSPMSRLGAPAAGTTLYVNVNLACTTDTGDGTVANPYCSIQDGVNGAASGDTVSVSGGQSSVVGTLTLGAANSNLTIVSSNTDKPTWLIAANQDSGKPALVINGASNVKLSNFDFDAGGNGTPTVEIIGSSGVTLDSDIFDAGTGLSNGAVSIDGTSSGVTLSRTSVAQVNWAPGDLGVKIALGASNVVLASDLFDGFGGGSIAAHGVHGLDVVGSTIQRSCGSAITVDGGSTAVSLENNLLEDANSTSNNYGYPAHCASLSLAWAPDVTVAADSAAGTASTYNDFYSHGSDNTAPYSWSGTTYSTLAAFRTATGQGTQDASDTVQATSVVVSPNWYMTMDGKLAAGSAAIGSANVTAPGALSSDYYGNAPYVDRGAFAYTWDNLVAALTVTDTSAMSVSASGAKSTGTQPITGYSFNWGDNQTTQSATSTATHTYNRPGVYAITLTVTDAKAATSTTSLTGETAGSGFTPYGPTRILDTRNGTGGVAKQLTAGQVLKLRVAGNGGIPASTTAVALNITITDSTGFGNVAAYPDGAAQPTTSNLNYTSGQTVPNAAVVPVGSDGYIDLVKQGPGAVDLIADANGYFSPAGVSGYMPVAPNRVLDTRYGIGGISTKLTAANSPFKVQVPGPNIVVAGTVTAVAVNLTLTDSTGFGNVAAYPDGSKAPGTSNLNYASGQTVANLAIVPVGPDGYIDLTKQGPGAVSMIVDIEGYFSSFANGAMSAYVPVDPVREFDSRTLTNGKLKPSYYYAIGLDQDTNNQPFPGVTGLMLNTTVTDVTGVGFLTVFPDNTDGPGGSPGVPNASNLNFAAGQTVPNLTSARPGTNGVVDFFNGSLNSSLNLIVDLFGYFQND